MSTEHKLECEYCGIPIKDNDYKCPNCGADCSKVIKKYKEEQEKELTEKKEKLQQFFEGRFHKIANSAKIITIISICIFVFIFILFFTLIFRNISKQDDFNEDVNKNIKENFFKKDDKNQKVSVGYNEVAVTKNYSIIIDSYEFYEYDSENFSNSYRTRDGYQKIAFNFLMEGLSDVEVNTYFSANVSLKADDYFVEEVGLEAGVFEYVVSGRESYPKFIGSVTKGEKLQGYLGYLVPKDKKVLTFKVGDNVTIVMDNPCYEG